jgi:hypothetical protein
VTIAHSHRSFAPGGPPRRARWSLGPILLPLLLCTSFASAESLLHKGRAEGLSSIEMLPDANGDTWARMRHGLSLQAHISPHFAVIADGQLLIPLATTDVYAWDEASIQRLAVRYTSPKLSITAGRYVHAGTLGLTRVDGIQLELGSDDPVGVSVWGGRVGHAESLAIGGDLGAGAQFRVSPGAFGLATGYDVRGTPVNVAHRIHLSSSVRDKKGFALFVLAELGFDSHDDTAEDEGEGAEEDAEEDSSAVGFRAVVQSSLPLGTRATLRLGGRYYGLPPITVPWSSHSVVETIRPTDYGVAEVSLELRPRNNLRFRFEGGPAIGQETEGYEDLPEDSEEIPGIETGVAVGGTGKLSFDWAGLGLYGTGTSVGASWYAGGGVGMRHEVGPVHLWGEAGIYRFEGLDGTQATIGEARFQGGIALPVKPKWGQLGLVVRTAVGTDRLLSPWWRAGVALQARVGTARGAL